MFKFVTFLIIGLIICISSIIICFYSIWLSDEIITIYKHELNEQKESILNSCAALSRESCPKNQEKNPSEFSSLAIEWRKICNIRINESKIYTISDNLETIAMRNAIQRIQYHHPSHTWIQTIDPEQCSLFNPICIMIKLLYNPIYSLWILLFILMVLSLFVGCYLPIRLYKRWIITLKIDEDGEQMQNTKTYPPTTGYNVYERMLNQSDTRSDDWDDDVQVIEGAARRRNRAYH